MNGSAGNFSWSEMAYWAFMAICIVTAIALLARAWVLRHRSERTKGNIQKLLRKMGALRHWKVLGDVTVSEGGQTAKLDHVVVAPYGVFLFCDIYAKGCYYGKIEDDMWVCTDGDEENTKREPAKNPAKECQAAVEILRRLFAREGLYKMQVEYIVPTTGKQITSYVSGSQNIILTPKELQDRLSSKKYDKDNGVDLEKVTALFTKAEK